MPFLSHSEAGRATCANDTITPGLTDLKLTLNVKTKRSKDGETNCLVAKSAWIIV